MPATSPPAPVTSAAALLVWLPTVRRDLPWRRRRDPYAVWIAEVMLQQTQVATVVPYFERWLARFPGVAELAAAPLGEVLKAWEGLGYYARARNLHRAAQQIAAEHGGQIPSDPAALRRLPGIGRYTAGAILSLAFGQRQAAVDGNVRRVLCRLHDIAEDPCQPAVEKHLWELAEALVAVAPDGSAGDLNEALMELGALVCTPGQPACATCPLADTCLAHARGVEAQRPFSHPRPPTPHYDVTAGVIADSAGRTLLVQRPPEGLLGGLWGFPGGTVQGDETLEMALTRGVLAQTGLRVTVGAPLLRLRHAYTHFRITLHAFGCALGEAAGPAGGSAARPLAWAAPAELADYPLPVTDRKIANALP